VLRRTPFAKILEALAAIAVRLGESIHVTCHLEEALRS